MSFEDMEQATARRANALAVENRALMERNDDLMDALEALFKSAPPTVECNNMHHIKKHRHADNETCPAVVAYIDALRHAAETISRANGGAA